MHIKDSAVYKPSSEYEFEKRALQDYKYALDHASVVAITDKNGIIIHVNDNFCKITKYSRKELIGQNHNIVNSGFHSKLFYEKLWNTICNNEIFRGEIKNKDKNGAFYWVDTTIVPFFDESGTPYQFVSITTEITNRKEAEEQLRKKEIVCQSIVENLPDTIIDIRTIENEKLFLDGEGLKKWGLKKTDNFDIQKLKGVEPETASKILMLRNKALNGEKVSLILPIKENIYKVSFLPLKDHQNGIYAVMALYVDITHIKIEEKKLRKSEASLKTIFDNTDTGYILLDDNFNIVSYNKKISFFLNEHFQEKVVKGMELIRYLLEKKCTNFFRDLEDVKRGISSEHEFCLSLENGLFKWYKTGIHRVVNSENVLDGTLISVLDISKNKILEQEENKIKEELVMRNNDLEQFTHIISHNLRSPVASILGLSNLLTDDLVESEDILEIVQGIKQSTQKLDDVILDINKILSLNKDIHIVKSIINLEEMADDIDFKFIHNLYKLKYNIITNFSDKPEIFSIYSYWYSILYNLISNSIKFSNPDGEIKIDIKSGVEHNNNFIIYSDNGIGFDLNKFGNKVFGLYNRFHTSLEGKGVGLFMVKKQVELIGGRIYVSSEEQIGTIFKIIFPIENQFN